VKALPALLCLLLLALGPACAAELDAPQTLPIIYDQPGEKYLLRIDNRRYQLPYITKEDVVRLLSAANYPRTKLRFDEFKRALEDKAKAEMLVNRAQQNAARETERVDRLRRSLESLRAQLALLRAQPNIDVRELQFLQEQIRNTAASLAAAEAQEAKAQLNLDKTKHSTESAFVRADKAREDYVAALDAYEKPLAEIRKIAMTHGTAL
jgi:multidrug efflux pump subunit AcrA (membrane-fusion protein)